MTSSFLLAQNSLNSFRRLFCCFLVPSFQEADMVSIAPFDKFVLFSLNQTSAPRLCPFSATLGEPALVIGVSTKMFSLEFNNIGTDVRILRTTGYQIWFSQIVSVEYLLLHPASFSIVPVVSLKQAGMHKILSQTNPL